MGKWINEAMAFKGKVGELHGSSINGRPYLKGPYKKRAKKAKGGEKQNHSKFALAHNWLSPIVDYVRSGFNGFTYKEKSQGFTAAKSYLLTHAFEGEGAELKINPALVKVSYGTLPLATNIKLTLQEKNQLKFTWENTWTPGMKSYDQVMLLAYDINNKQANMITTGAFRLSGEAILNVFDNSNSRNFPNGAILHCYLAFVAADRSRQSDSVYLGEIVFHPTNTTTGQV